MTILEWLDEKESEGIEKYEISRYVAEAFKTTN